MTEAKWQAVAMCAAFLALVAGGLVSLLVFKTRGYDS
jgi:hypothetical protein